MAVLALSALSRSFLLFLGPRVRYRRQPQCPIFRAGLAGGLGLQLRCRFPDFTSRFSCFVRATLLGSNHCHAAPASQTLFAERNPV